MLSDLGVDGVREQKMFGGLAFLVGGHMAVAASREGGVLLSVDRSDTDALLEQAAHPTDGDARPRAGCGVSHAGPRPPTCREPRTYDRSGQVGRYRRGRPGRCPIRIR